MNLESEVRKGYTVSTDMKKLWAVEMELLKKLLEVCEKHHLKIWADGGTLLGAVREHGYIPWDDDIDMAMLRDDYEKLIAISQKEFKSPYFFQCGYTENKYPRGHAQLRKDGTAAILKGVEIFSFHQGIFIDIFVYDVVPADELELCSLKKSLYSMRSNLLKYCKSRLIISHPIDSIKLLMFMLPIKIKGFKWYFKQFDDLLKGHQGNNVACMGFIWDLNRYERDISVYDNTEYLPFEDILMPVPSGYDTILYKQYGDYMEPAKTPTMHGGFAILDTEKSYKIYLPLIRKKAKKEILQYRISKIKKILAHFY